MSFLNRLIRIGLLSLIFLYFPCAQAIEIALTVDDLPVSGPLPSTITRLNVANKMLAAFKKHHLENVYGFINGEWVNNKTDGLKVLQTWIKEGQLLGNHTFTHMNLNKVSAEKYIADIKRNDFLLKQLMKDKNYKYFRYPFHAEGNTEEKREAVRHYLLDHGYQIVPATIDFNDFEWNPPYVRCLNKHNSLSITKLQNSFIAYSLKAIKASHALSRFLFNRDIRYILVMHIGLIDADEMDRLLTAYEQEGVKFISLPDALSDPAYHINPSIIRDRYYMYLKRQGMQNVTVPASLTKIYASVPKPILDNVCR